MKAQETAFVSRSDQVDELLFVFPEGGMSHRQSGTGDGGSGRKGWRGMPCGISASASVQLLFLIRTRHLMTSYKMRRDNQEPTSLTTHSVGTAIDTELRSNKLSERRGSVASGVTPGGLRQIVSHPTNHHKDRDKKAFGYRSIEAQIYTCFPSTFGSATNAKLSVCRMKACS